MDRIRQLFIFIMITCMGIACSESLPKTDAGNDAAFDFISETSNDAPNDLITETNADLPYDLMSDGTISDLYLDIYPRDLPMQPDFGPLPVHTITFAYGTQNNDMTMTQINTDGTGYKKLSGWGSLDLGQTMFLVGTVKEYYPLSRDIPQLDKAIPYDPIYLPRGLGYARWYKDTPVTGPSTVGLLVHRPNGDIDKLYSIEGSSVANDLMTYWAVTQDGDVMVGVRKKVGIVMVRTNGTTFANGKTFIEFDPIPDTHILSYQSLTFVGSNLFFVTNTPYSAGYQHSLWVVPIDGSRAPATISMPKINGEDVKVIDGQIAAAANASVAVVQASNSTTAYMTTLISINSSGVAVNITNSPAYYGKPGDTWGYSGSEAQLALSPSGNHMAYVKIPVGGKDELYITTTDGLGTPVNISSSSNMSSAATSRKIHCVRFIDDNSLIFTAGEDGRFTDIYRYDVTTQNLYNVTGYGSTTKPYDLKGSMLVRAMWFSPNRKHLLFIDQSWLPNDETIDIRAVDLQTWKVKEITKGVVVQCCDECFKACENGSKMFFAAEPYPQSGVHLELYSFDMNTASAAIQLTSIGQGLWQDNQISRIFTAPDCEHVAFPSGDNTKDLYVGRAISPVSIRNVTQMSGKVTQYHIAGTMLIPNDSSQVVYLANANLSRLDMYTVRLKGSSPAKFLHGGAAGNKNQWVFLGIK